MALRNMVFEGEDTLRKKCKPVTDFNRKLAVLLDDMADTMYDRSGVGLAAPQVGVLRRVVIIDTTPDEEVGVKVEMINPEIISREGTQTGQEGCLSVPGRYGIVERPMKVTARYQDRKGKFHEIRHTVYLTPGSRVAALMGTDRLEGCSSHNYCAQQVSPRLTVSGRTADGTVEVLEYEDWVLGTQFHPELEGRLPQLFGWLCK